jgi:hypothetical protein
MKSLCILLCLWIRQQVILMKQIGQFFQAYSSASMVSEMVQNKLCLKNAHSIKTTDI